MFDQPEAVFPARIGQVSSFIPGFPELARHVGLPGFETMKFAGHIGPEEEGVVSPNIRAQKNIAFALGEPVERCQRTAIVQVRMMSYGAVKVFFIGDANWLESEQAVVFDDHDS